MVGIIAPFVWSGLIATAQQLPVARTHLLNRDVVEMARAGVDRRSLIQSIREQPNRFDVSPPALVSLHREGLAQPVILAMMEAARCGPHSDLAKAKRCPAEEHPK